MPARTFCFVVLTSIIPFFFAFLIPSNVNAQIVINAINPATDPEWIELYNSGEETKSLEGCTLFLDDNHDIQKIHFTSSDELSTSEKYKVIKK